MIPVEVKETIEAFDVDSIKTWQLETKKSYIFWQGVEKYIGGRFEKLNLSRVNPDDHLFAGEPWHDFGNYKEKGINPNDEIFFLRAATHYEAWRGNVKNDKNQFDVVWNKTTNEFWSVKEQGNCNHSENNDKPLRNAFGENLGSEVPYGYNLEKLQEIIENLEEIEALVNKKIAIFEIFVKKTHVARIQARLNEYIEILEDLKLNHKRAWKKIQNAESDVERQKKAIAKFEKEIAEFEKYL